MEYIQVGIILLFGLYSFVTVVCFMTGLLMRNKEMALSGLLIPYFLLKNFYDLFIKGEE